jgi:hypothetical protein
MYRKITSILGLLVLVACVIVPAITVAGISTVRDPDISLPEDQLKAADARGKPTGGSGVGTAGPASKAGADGGVKKYALCVGVSNYIDPGIGDLSYCDEDAADWSNYLRGMGYSVSSLVDSQAKEASVESALFNIIRAADADDIVAFITSGHGTSSGGKQLLLYADCYAPAADGDGFVSGVVPDVELKNWFAKCTSKVFIFVDHCNSGGLREAMHANMYMTTTCSASGYGYDVPDYQNGAWTYTYLHLALEQGYTNAEAAFSYASGIYPYGGKDAPCQFDQFTGNFVF